MTPEPSAHAGHKWPFEGVAEQGELVAYKLRLDAGIEPGRIYRVRPTTQGSWLFRGKPMRLLEIRPASHCYRLKFQLTPEEIPDPSDERCLCVYTDSWQPAALALTPVATETERRMMHMMARNGLDPGIAASSAVDADGIDGRTRAIIEAARRRCEDCSAEDHCDEWLAGRAPGDDAFCPNAPTFRELAGRGPDESEGH